MAANVYQSSFRTHPISTEDAVFYLQDFASGGVHQKRVGADAHPFIARWWHFKGKEPVVR